MGMRGMKPGSGTGHLMVTWTCVCGRVCRGNGGRSSHQRACREWKLERLRRTEAALAQPDTGDMRSKLRRQLRPTWVLTCARLRRELGLSENEEIPPRKDAP